MVIATQAEQGPFCSFRAAKKGQKSPRCRLLAPPFSYSFTPADLRNADNDGQVGGGQGKSVTAGDRGACGVSAAPRFSDQVHFFISSYPCPALQLADQQSAAVCFNQAAPPLLQTGPDYRGGAQGGGGKGGEDVFALPSQRWKR